MIDVEIEFSFGYFLQLEGQRNVPARAPRSRPRKILIDTDNDFENKMNENHCEKIVGNVLETQ
jgi:hypothetical protein